MSDPLVRPDGAELELAAAEWIRETCELLQRQLELEYPETGGLGRGLRRELLTIHRRKGLGLLRGETPETNAADALREAVAWYELRQESGADPKDLPGEEPRWVQWAWRLLPGCGLSRWALLSHRTSVIQEAGR